MAGKTELGSGVGIKLTNVQPGTEAFSGRVRAPGWLEEDVLTAVAPGALPASTVAVPFWLAGLQAASTKARSSKRNKSLRGIRFSFREISPNFTSETGYIYQTLFRDSPVFANYLVHSQLMGRNGKSFAPLAVSLLVFLALSACTSKLTRLAPTPTLRKAATFTAIDLPKSPAFTFTRSPSPTSTYTPAPPTATLVPPTFTPLPPTLTPTPLACAGHPGRIETGSLSVEYLTDPLIFRIYLPPCYDAQPERRFPVLYLLHGQGAIDDQWVRLGVPETCDALFTSGEAAPFLVVMPRDRVWKQPSEDGFGQALIDRLLPWVDAHYRTLPDREHRAIGGLSRGAAWAVHLGLSQWELFSAIGAHSLPIFWEDVPDLEGWVDQIPVQSFPRLYMDIGDLDRPEVLESSIWFEELLTDKGIPHEWHLFAGEHEESYWQAHIAQYLRWYAARW